MSKDDLPTEFSVGTDVPVAKTVRAIVQDIENSKLSSAATELQALLDAYAEKNVAVTQQAARQISVMLGRMNSIKIGGYEDRVTAPRTGEQLLLLIVPRRDRESMLGDLEEEFRRYAQKFGHRYALIWYYVQVAKLAVHYPVDYFIGMLERVAKWLKATA